ncbi:hypothetical protein PMAYCL1PPCAC_00905, partial [Pristionchus mayeri]
LSDCLDPKKDPLLVGEVKTMEDGSIWSCYRDKSGEIKMAQEKSGGCVYNGTIYKNGKTWTRDVEIKVTVAGKEKVVGTAESMKCVNDGKTGFTAQAYGCVTATGLWLRHGAFSKVREDFVQCIVAKGVVTMKLVAADEVSCDFKGITVKSGENYTTPENDIVYCKYGMIQKIG